MATISPDFRIYYDGGETYDGDPFYAPAFGVLVIVQKDKNHGRCIESNKDYFVWINNKWLGVDYIGMIDYLAQPGCKRVLFGRMVNDEYYNSVYRIANDDPDFPLRTAYAAREVKR